MIPICLVTGFLGSGKTTLLQQVCQRLDGRRIVYIVNEFSPLDVDGARLDLPEEALVPIPGGSIFCRCKVEDFLRVLKVLAGESSPPEGVVIEATGMADPRVVAKMLSETKMDQVFELARIVTVVDPGRFPKLIQTLPTVVHQVEAADVVLLNMTDRFSADEIAETRKLVAAIRPDALLLETVRCEAEIDLFGEGPPARSLAGELAECANPDYTQGLLEFDQPIQWELLRKELEKNSGMLYRIKGRVPVPGGALDVDYSAAGWLVTEAASDKVASGLVLIGNRDAGLRIGDLERRARTGAYAV